MQLPIDLCAHHPPTSFSFSQAASFHFLIFFQPNPSRTAKQGQQRAKMSSIHDLAAAAVAGTSSHQKGDDSTSKKRGAFIVLEGLDRSGKTTQVKLLEQRFVEEGRPAKVMRFPGEFFFFFSQKTNLIFYYDLSLRN
jgi:hypothetical protein